MRNAPSDLQHAVDCTCEQASMCAAEGPGHTLSAIQLRVASATPSKWQDAIVRSVSSDGGIVLSPAFGGFDVAVWHHADLSGTVSIGEPVSLHALYSVLVAGGRHFNVRSA